MAFLHSISILYIHFTCDLNKNRRDFFQFHTNYKLYTLKRRKKLFNLFKLKKKERERIN